MSCSCFLYSRMFCPCIHYRLYHTHDMQGYTSLYPPGHQLLKVKRCVVLISENEKCLSLSPVQLFVTSWTVASVHGILRTRILEWVAMPFSWGPSGSRDCTHVSYISCIFISPALQADSLPSEPPGKPIYLSSPNTKPEI